VHATAIVKTCSLSPSSVSEKDFTIKQYLQEIAGICNQGFFWQGLYSKKESGQFGKNMHDRTTDGQTTNQGWAAKHKCILLHSYLLKAKRFQRCITSLRQSYFHTMPR
jgi:hypothetical protein